MSQYNIFHAMVASFYSRDLYRDVAKNWGGKALFYLLVLLALSWIPFCFILQHTLNQGYQKNSDKYAAQFPVLTIKDGKISTPENHPYFVTDPDTHENVVVIDTTGQYTTLDQAKAQVLVTDTEVISRPKPNEIRTDKIPSTLNMEIDPQVVNGYVKHYLGFAWVAFFILFLLGSYIYRIIQALIYGIIGKIFTAMTSSPLSYGQVWIMSMVAITPAVVLATICDIFSLSYPLQSFSYFLLAMIYLFYGVVANKN